MRPSRRTSTKQANSDGWARSARGRKELTAVSVLYAAILVLPLSVGKLYPLSAATMFSSRVEKCCAYEVFDPDGNRLSNRRFGLHVTPTQKPSATNRPQNESVQASRPSINQNWLIAQRKSVSERVRSHLANSKKPRLVYIVQKVIGPKDNRSVGIVGARVWTVMNPRYEDVGLTIVRGEKVGRDEK